MQKIKIQVSIGKILVYFSINQIVQRTYEQEQLNKYSIYTCYF